MRDDNELKCSWFNTIPDVVVQFPDNASYKCGDPFCDFGGLQWEVNECGLVQEVVMPFCNPGFVLVDGACCSAYNHSSSKVNHTQSSNFFFLYMQTSR